MTATMQNPTMTWNPDAATIRANGVNRGNEAVGNTPFGHNVPFVANPYVTQATQNPGCYIPQQNWNPLYSVIHPTTFNPINAQFQSIPTNAQIVNTPYGPALVASPSPTQQYINSQVPCITPNLHIPQPLTTINPLLGLNFSTTPNAFNTQWTLCTCPVTGQCSIQPTSPNAFVNPGIYNPLNAFFRAAVPGNPADLLAAISCGPNVCNPFNTGWNTPQPAFRTQTQPFLTTHPNATWQNTGFPTYANPFIGGTIQNPAATGYPAACGVPYPTNVAWLQNATLGNPLNACVTC